MSEYRTNFYVCPTGDIRNGGSSDASPLIVSSHVNVGAANVVVDQLGNGWNGAAAGDWLCWDTEGVRQRARIVSIAGNNATVDRPLTTDGSNKSSRVKGPFSTIQSALDAIDATFVNANGDPPFINVILGTYNENPVANHAGTPAVPITIEAYTAVPGDLRGTMTCAVVQKNSGISTNGLFQINADYVNVRNISVSTTQSGKHGFYLAATRCSSLINCKAAALCAAVNLAGTYGSLLDTCLVTSGGNGYPAVFVNSAFGTAIINTAVTGVNTNATGAIGLYGAYGTLVMGCTFRLFVGDCITIMNASWGVQLLNNTVYNTGGNFLNAGMVTNLTSVVIENSIFCGMSGNVVYSTAATNVPLARFAHNMVRYCASPYFSANVVSAVEDVNTTDNPFADDYGVTLSAAARSHAIQLTDGTYTYPDLGAVQTRPPMLVHGGMTGGIRG